jgi:hypothetical protein
MRLRNAKDNTKVKLSLKSKTVYRIDYKTAYHCIMTSLTSNKTYAVKLSTICYESK